MYTAFLSNIFVRIVCKRLPRFTDERKNKHVVGDSRLHAQWPQALDAHHVYACVLLDA